jgi:hypothetical protein
MTLSIAKGGKGGLFSRCPGRLQKSRSWFWRKLPYNIFTIILNKRKASGRPGAWLLAISFFHVEMTFELRRSCGLNNSTDVVLPHGNGSSVLVDIVGGKTKSVRVLYGGYQYSADEAVPHNRSGAPLKRTLNVLLGKEAFITPQSSA